MLQMDNPYLLLNRQAFEAAGISEEEAENTTKAMVEQIFAGFGSAGDGTVSWAQKEPQRLRIFSRARRCARETPGHAVWEAGRA